MNEVSIPKMPVELFDMIGGLVIDRSSKKKLYSNIHSFLTLSFSNFLIPAKTTEDRKEFISNVNQTLFKYSLQSRKVAFLDLKLDSYEQKISFLRRYKELLGAVEFEIPLYSIEEVEKLCKEAELTRISLKGKISLSNSFERLQSLPKIERLKLRDPITELVEIGYLKSLGASLLSIRIGRALNNSLSLKGLNSLKIESFRTCKDITLSPPGKNPETFPYLKKLAFRSSHNSFLRGYLKNSDIEKLIIMRLIPSPIASDQLETLKNLTTLFIKDAYPLQENEYLKLPHRLRKLTVVSKRAIIDPDYFNQATHLKALDISLYEVADVKFLKPTLKTLILNMKELSFKDLETVLPTLNLKHLTLKRLKAPSDFFKKLKSQKHLRTLCLEKSRNIDLEELSNFIKKVKLRHLSLKMTSVVGSFSKSFKGVFLYSLDVSQTTICIKDLTLAYLKKLTISVKQDFVAAVGKEINLTDPDNLAILRKINGLKVVTQNDRLLRM
ncbi:hypothetical protein [Criblamydia sequanensis]|uniref:Uncharacterized protein n=1 Tax=Candidatus Criblamydia sequanensis CRIB-18 TaxID=1437425 RepID=A0A090D1B7_9BACT|nr:hypothetical protein [Criblamydia sequanensis]CDR33710.1 hypothetical protein CSEC_0882 [Criblamydia sequanensis CRIB-18]